VAALQQLGDVRLDQHGPATVVTVRGDIDLFAAPSLRAALDEAMTRRHPIVVDLCDCSFFDSGGLHALLNTDLASDRPLLVARPEGSPAARMLDVSAPGHFAPYASRDDALAVLSS
jgi:anti-sigma B factor antagonist